MSTGELIPRALLIRSLMAVVFAAPGAAAQVGQFRASAVKVDITPTSSKWLAGYPPRQSTGVHDRIFHRVVAMDDGVTQFFLASTDLCLIAPSVYDEFAVQLKKETGIDRSRSGGRSLTLILLPKWARTGWRS